MMHPMKFQKDKTQFKEKDSRPFLTSGPTAEESTVTESRVVESASPVSTSANSTSMESNVTAYLSTNSSALGVTAGGPPAGSGSRLVAFGCLLLAVLAAYGAAGVSYLGFDWGYFLVEKLFGQVPSQQGQTAWMLFAAVMPQLCFAAVAPWFTKSGTLLRRWLPLLFIVGSYLFICREAGVEDVIEAGPLIATLFLTTAALCTGVNALSGKIVDWLKSMKRSTSLVATSIGSLVLFGLFCLASGSDWLNPFHGNMTMGFSVFSMFILTSGAAAALISGTRKEATGVAFAAGANLPVLVIAILNFAMTVVSYGLDKVATGLDLGWRAIPSAFVILLAAIAFTALGGYGAIRLRNRAGE